MAKRVPAARGCSALTPLAILQYLSPVSLTGVSCPGCLEKAPRYLQVCVGGNNEGRAKKSLCVSNQGQREECQDRQSWNFGREKPRAAWCQTLCLRSPAFLFLPLSLLLVMLEFTEPGSYPGWGLRGDICQAYCQESSPPHFPSLILLSHTVSEHPTLTVMPFSLL